MGQKIIAILPDLTSTETCITSQVMLRSKPRLYFCFLFEEPLASFASHAACFGPGFPGPRFRLSTFRSAVLPCRVPRQVLEEVHADILEFLADQPEAEEENPHVVLRAFGAEGALVFRARALRVFGEGGDDEAEDDVAFDLSGVGCSVEGPNLDRSGPPYVVQVDRSIALMFSST